MTDNQKPITERAVGSLKWSVLIEAVTRTAMPITILILARLLTPLDFGIISIATVIISFSQMFWDAGLSKALIQTKEEPEKAANVVFWTNLALGLFIYCLLLITAPWIATFFMSPASMNVLRILGIQIVIAALTSVHQSLFIRNLNFRWLFWARFASAFIPALFSIPLAFLGYGVWALVAGSLAGQLVNSILLWMKSTWKPTWKFNKQISKPLFTFGLWVMGESLAAWFLLWGDNLIVGKFLGLHDLGIYRTGWMIVMTIFGLVLNPFLPLLYPTFSLMQDNKESFMSTFHHVNRLVIALALPIGIVLLLFGPELSDTFFGASWTGLGLVISVIGLQQGLAWLVSINTEVYRAMGRPDLNTKLLFFSTCIFLPAYLISIPFGINVFLYTRLALTLPGILIHIFILNRFLKISKYYLWHEGNKILLAVFAMFVIIGSLKVGFSYVQNGLPALIKLILMSMAAIIVYTVCLWFADRLFVVQIKNLFKRVFIL